MLRLSVLLSVCVFATSIATQDPPNFESPQANSIAISPDGSRLFVVNTPDARLAIFDLRNPRRPVLLGEVRVGLEPVAVRPRTADEVWVVNHLSDAISVIDVDAGEVVATLECEDEPSDVAFAAGRAFVTSATRRKVVVYDAAARTRVGDIDVFCEEPRALVASPDGTRVYAISRLSGNDTTLLPRESAPPQPAPTNTNLPPAPDAGLIVDSEDPAWSATHGVSLPDWDVFEIDAATLAVTRRVSGVGTVLFGGAFRPGSDELWVANTEARNLIRFEPSLRGHAADNRVTRIALGSPTPGVSAFDLNPGVNYAVLPNPGALASSLAQPTSVAFSPDGSELFITAFGTDRLGVLSSADGSVLARIEIGGGTTTRAMRGPRSLAHHPTADVLYVMNRLSNTVSLVDTTTRAQFTEIGLVYDPTPSDLKEGRGFLYDARLSGNGTMSCATCHIDAALDGLAWDLGDPGGVLENVPGPLGLSLPVHPMKGPMTTQTLQGLRTLAPLHWRGDRALFQDFNGAFASLMGGAQVSTTDMDDYAAFIDTVVLASNPNRLPDGTLPHDASGVSPQDGFDFYTTQLFNGTLSCVNCHSLDTGSNRLIIPGNVLQEPEPFKVPQLRTAYRRTGFEPVGGLRTTGFGLLHDGSIESVFDLLTLPVFGPLTSQSTNKQKLENFVLHFDTGLQPAVGRARTVDATNRVDTAVLADWNLLEAEALEGSCDLVAHGSLDGEPIGFLWRPSQSVWQMDRAGQVRSRAQLDSLIASGRLTLTLLGVVPGQGARVGIDRDGDGVLDGDEGLTKYGSPTPGCGLDLAGNSPPTAGNGQFALVCRGVPPGAPGVVAISAAKASVPILGFDVLVDLGPAVMVVAHPDAAGVAPVPLPIGASPALVGATVHTQAVFATPCGPQGLAASGGLTVVVGAP